MGKNNFDEDNFAGVCDNECPNASSDLSVSHEDLTFDPKSDSVKEYVFIEASSSPHRPLCSANCNESICDEDTPCSLFSSSDELSQGSEVVHDEIENNQNIEYFSHPLSSLLLHEDNSSNQLAH